MIRSFQYTNFGFEKNWGDIIASPIIYSFLKDLNIEIKPVNQSYKENIQKIVSVGSVSTHIKEKDIVWGTGCISQGMVKTKPHKILAVRGPLTRNEYLIKGIKCPDVYGDPALLMPLIWNKDIIKTHKIGIIPHYIDKDNPNLINLEKEGYKIIDICSGITEFLEDLLSVELVLSSSLHGLIAADAYKIPNSRIIFSNKIIGGHFKFIDYFLSVNRKIDYGYYVQSHKLDINSLVINDTFLYSNNLLLENAPWNSKEIIQYLDV